MNTKRIVVPSKNLQNRRFDQIQVLRGLAALAVVFCHLPTDVLVNMSLPFHTFPGGFGVDVFFVISGFIMMYITEKGTKHFLEKRIIRIFPLYWLCTIVYGLYSGFVNSRQILHSMLLLPPDPIVRQAWTLIYEIMFYIIILCATKSGYKYRGIIASMILVVIAVLGIFIKNKVGDILGFYFYPTPLEFIYGIIAYELIKHKDIKINKLLCIAVCIVTVFIMYVAKFIIFRNEYSMHIDIAGVLDWPLRFLFWGLGAFIIFIFFFYAFRTCKIPRFYVLIGDISFSIYLWHAIIIDIVKKSGAFDLSQIHQWLLAVIIIVAITTLVSCISYYLFEKKLLNWFNRKLK